jgi:kynurenine formamidase
MRTVAAGATQAALMACGPAQPPPRGFEVVALPMRIRGGSGGPLRIIAVLSP